MNASPARCTAIDATFAVGTFPDSVVIGDFNRDGKADVAVANLNSDNVSILIGDGAGSFATATSVAVSGHAKSIAVGDFNRDGKTDLAVFRPSNGNWYIIPSSNPSAAFSQLWGTNSDVPAEKPVGQ